MSYGAELIVDEAWSKDRLGRKVVADLFEKIEAGANRDNKVHQGCPIPLKDKVTVLRSGGRIIFTAHYWRAGTFLFKDGLDGRLN